MDDYDQCIQTIREVCVSSSVCACALRPVSFFIAWNGVLTLVYSGFPPTLARLKAELNALPQPTLKPENFGSKWPKTTLGALVDDAPEFSLDELRELRALCLEHAPRLEGLLVHVTQLSLVHYISRGLEKAGRCRTAEIELPAAAKEEVDAEPREIDRNIVSRIICEWDNAQAYLPHVNAPGSRINTYRAASPSGSTLVGFLQNQAPAELEKALAAFRVAVDTLLPGRYAWLADESLHCTLRAISD